MGAKFATPMPLLWQHRSSEPVGNVTFATPTEKGIPFEAQLPVVKESGKLKDRIDEAIQSMKYGLVRAVSIGFSVIKHEVMKSGGLDIKEWEWLELSLVTIPANSEALITAVKSLSGPAPAQGEPPAPVKIIKPPGDTGKKTYVKLNSKGGTT
jgi:HK97 family phage prohead protease